MSDIHQARTESDANRLMMGPSTKLDEHVPTVSRPAVCRCKAKSVCGDTMGHDDATLDAVFRKHCACSGRQSTPTQQHRYSESPSTTDHRFKSIAGRVYLDSEEHMTTSNSEPENLDFNKSVRLIPCVVDNVYRVFLGHHSCFELMPTSGRVLVLDSKLSVKKSFYALVFNNIRAAIVSTFNDDTQSPEFTSILSISDFIELLTLFYKSKNEHIYELENNTIERWKHELNCISIKCGNQFVGKASRKLIKMSPGCSLLDAVKMSENEKVHRIPIIDPETNDFLFFATKKRILRFLFIRIYDIPRPGFLDQTIRQLQLGTFVTDNGRINRDHVQKIYTIGTRNTLIHALRLFVKTGVSALPIVDHSGRLKGMFSRFDVIRLAADGTYGDLDRTVQDALLYRHKPLESVLCCHMGESLITVMVRFAENQVHRLVIVDRTRRVTGVLSLSDILSFLIKPR